MENNFNLLEIYKQTKQRIDLDIDFTNKKVIGKTKLTYMLKSEQNLNITMTNPYLRLNAENMVIKKINIYSPTTSENKLENESKNLKFSYMPPSKVQDYINHLYSNIEDIDSLKNIDRFEWETRQQGNLEIFFNENKLIDENNMKDINNSFLTKKLKISIEYEVDKEYAGIIFQSFYDERIDANYDICYTPNFVKYI
jgi:hypothetical protein